MTSEEMKMVKNNKTEIVLKKMSQKSTSEMMTK